VRSHRWARLGTWGLSNGLRFAPAAARLDASSALKASSNWFSANPQGGIDLALGLALFLKLRHQDCGCSLLFEQWLVCMACRGAGVRIFLAPFIKITLPQWFYFLVDSQLAEKTCRNSTNLSG